MAHQHVSTKYNYSKVSHANTSQIKARPVVCHGQCWTAGITPVDELQQPMSAKAANISSQLYAWTAVINLWSALDLRGLPSTAVVFRGRRWTAGVTQLAALDLRHLSVGPPVSQRWTARAIVTAGGCNILIMPDDACVMYGLWIEISYLRTYRKNVYVEIFL